MALTSTAQARHRAELRLQLSMKTLVNLCHRNKLIKALLQNWKAEHSHVGSAITDYAFFLLRGVRLHNR